MGWVAERGGGYNPSNVGRPQAVSSGRNYKPGKTSAESRSPQMHGDSNRLCSGGTAVDVGWIATTKATNRAKAEARMIYKQPSVGYDCTATLAMPAIKIHRLSSVSHVHAVRLGKFVANQLQMEGETGHPPARRHLPETETQSCE